MAKIMKGSGGEWGKGEGEGGRGGYGAEGVSPVARNFPQFCDFHLHSC